MIQSFYAPNDLLLKYLYPCKDEFCIEDLFCTPPWNRDTFSQNFDIKMETLHLRGWDEHHHSGPYNYAEVKLVFTDEMKAKLNQLLVRMAFRKSNEEEEERKQKETEERSKMILVNKLNDLQIVQCPQCLLKYNPRTTTGHSCTRKLPEDDGSKLARSYSHPSFRPSEDDGPDPSTHPSWNN